MIMLFILFCLFFSFLILLPSPFHVFFYSHPVTIFYFNRARGLSVLPTIVNQMTAPAHSHTIAAVPTSGCGVKKGLLNHVPSPSKGLFHH